ncbi:MAG TPA: prepilin peptidase [Bryobacteraceae bacterium]|nr:prepilin peptidase [Bryobacteraceae bacterium]HPU71242.1 prepilin peptidase [Bryobacteraceae bacterium]
MMEALLALAAGLLIGSFLNVCIYRMPRDISVVRPRSFCPSCEHPIAWYDNVPVLSYISLGGRCRKCREPIPIRYPVVEMLTGLLFFGIVLVHGPSLAALKQCVFAALIVGLIFSDLEQRILPDEFTLGGVALALVLPQGWGPVWVSITQAVLGAGVISSVLWLVGVFYKHLRKREGLGLGDVKMVAMIGAFLGLHGALLTVVLGSVIGSVLGLGYILLTRKDASTYELPFGTFLGVAALVCGPFGKQLAAWIQGG